MNASGRIFWTVVSFCLVCTCAALSDIPREIEATEGIIQQMMRDQMPSLPQPSKASPNALESYDLMKATDEVMARVTSSQKFSAYLEQRRKELSPEQQKALDRKTQGMWMLEYAQTCEEVKPEIKAWLYVLFSFVPWNQALGGYHRLERYRPRDIVPALLLASKLQAPGMESPTAEQWKDLVGIVRQTARGTTNTEELTDCVAGIGVGALKLQQAGKADVPLPMIWNWMRDVQLPQPVSEPDNLLRLNLVKWEVAMAAKDFLAAVELAPQCRMRVFQPMLLEFAGKRTEAYTSLRELRQDSSLTSSERGGLLRFEPMVLMFSHRFDEAWQSIRRQRATPSLTAKESEWLDMMERLLGDYETAIRKREDKPTP